MELFNYLLKVSACSVLFFAFYLLVLRKLTFFKINRFYLLFSVLLSFVIPALQFTIEREVIVESTNIVQPVGLQNFASEGPSFQTHVVAEPEPLVHQAQPFNWYLLLPYLYGAVVVALLLLAAMRIYLLLKHTKQVKKINGLKLVAKQHGFTNCSFFNYVFIDKNSLSWEELAVLLVHEEVHAKQYHSIDKLIMTIVKAVLWFNPVIYLYDKALEETHEFEADETTSLNFGTEHYANLLLKLAVSKNSNPLIHNFVKSPIKERIKMLFNSKSKNMKKLAYLLVLPIGLGLIWGFTIDVVDVIKDAKNNEKAFTLILDAGHGGKDRGAEIGNYSEKAIALSMVNKIKAIAEAKGIKVVTTRNADQKISLQDRVKVDGSMLISLHVNSEPINSDGKRNGIEFFTAPNDGSLKIAKANSISYYVFKGIQNVQGISIKEKPQAKNLFLLREAKAPGIVLELGYLTNKNDLKFITNEENQNELARGIVNGILAYKEKTPTDEELEIRSGKLNPQGYRDMRQGNQETPQLNDTLSGKTVTGKVIGFERVKMKGEVLNLQVGNTVLPLSCYSFKDKVKVGDEIRVSIIGKVFPPPPPIGTDTATWSKKYDYMKSSYLVSKVMGVNGKIIYETPKYAFGYETNRARYAWSTIKAIEKDPNGTIKKIVLNDKNGFTINLNVAAQKFKTNDFNKGDAIEVKFIGEKLTGNKTYTTNQMIALYSRPKKHELINTALYSKFYDENGKQKTYYKPGKQIIDHDDLNVAYTPVKVYPKPILLRADSLNVNNLTQITKLKGATMKLFNGQLEADEVEMDSKMEIITAKKAKFTFEKGNVIESHLMVFDAKKGRINAKASNGYVKPSNFVN